MTLSATNAAASPQTRLSFNSASSVRAHSHWTSDTPSAHCRRSPSLSPLSPRSMFPRSNGSRACRTAQYLLWPAPTMHNHRTFRPVFGLVLRLVRHRDKSVRCVSKTTPFLMRHVCLVWQPHTVPTRKHAHHFQFCTSRSVHLILSFESRDV